MNRKRLSHANYARLEKAIIANQERYIDDRMAYQDVAHELTSELGFEISQWSVGKCCRESAAITFTGAYERQGKRVNGSTAKRADVQQIAKDLDKLTSDVITLGEALDGAFNTLVDEMGRLKARLTKVEDYLRKRTLLDKELT